MDLNLHLTWKILLNIKIIIQAMNKQERKLKGYYKIKKSLSRPKRCYCVRCSPKPGEISPSRVKINNTMKDSLDEYYETYFK